MNALRSWASSLGGEVVNSATRGLHVVCPGPNHSARDRSLSVAPSDTAPDGFVFFSFVRDDVRACREHILRRLGQPSERRAAPASRYRPTSSTTLPMDLWKAAVDPRGTIVETYLNGRGLELPDDVAGRVVRFHAACPFGPGVRHPAMITAFRSITTDIVTAIQRTALTPEGKKIGRKMLGRVAGAAIKITADTDVEQGLTVGEGFETGLAALMMGFQPVWALGSAQAIASFPVLSGIDALTMLEETDDGGANARAIKACGERWTANNREALIVTPRVRGDINTALVAA